MDRWGLGLASRQTGVSRVPEARRWLTPGLALAVVPAAVLFIYIYLFGVNVVYEDSWNGTLPLVLAFAKGHLTLAMLWAQHNGNRPLLPNLVLTLSDSVTGVDSKFDMYLGGFCWLVATFLLVRLAARTSTARGLWTVPAAFLLCDLTQVQNILWAYQFAWALTLMCVLVALTGLEEAVENRWLFLLAVAAAVVASYSTVQGLLIWPVGLTYALLRGVPRVRLWTWVMCGIATGFVYFWHLGRVFPSTQRTYPLTHPLQGLQFLLTLMGDLSPGGDLWAGAGLLAGTVVIGWIAYRHKIPAAALRLPLGLWLFGLLFDLLVTSGRTQLGLGNAYSSRYSTFNLLLGIGLYLAAVAIFNPSGRWPKIRAQAASHRLAAGVCAAVVILVLLQLAWSLPFGFKTGSAYQLERQAGAQALRAYRREPDGVLARELYRGGGAYVKSWARIMEARRWSVFS